MKFKAGDEVILTDGEFHCTATITAIHEEDYLPYRIDTVNKVKCCGDEIYLYDYPCSEDELRHITKLERALS